MEHAFDLSMTPATAFDITKRVSQWLTPQYHALMAQVRSSPIVNVDETCLKVDGVKFWLWTFVTKNVTLYVIRKNRGKGVLEEVLGADFEGYVGCDGWRSYSIFTKKLQRCWAHLLREAEWLSEHCEEGKGLYVGLKGLFNDLAEGLVGDPPLAIRKRLVLLGKCRLRYWLNKHYVSEEVKRFIVKVLNGFDYWFTFVLVKGLEATNNLAERALKEPVVQRKIMGTLRNEKGTVIYETMMSLIATWSKQGLATFEQMRNNLIQVWTTS